MKIKNKSREDAINEAPFIKTPLIKQIPTTSSNHGINRAAKLLSRTGVTWKLSITEEKDLGSIILSKLAKINITPNMNLDMYRKFLLLSIFFIIPLDTLI